MYWREQPFSESVPLDVGISTRLYSICCHEVECVCGRDEWVPLDDVKRLSPPPMPDGWRSGDPVPPGLTYSAVDRPPNSKTFDAFQLIGKPRTDRPGAEA